MPISSSRSKAGVPSGRRLLQAIIFSRSKPRVQQGCQTARRRASPAWWHARAHSLPPPLPIPPRQRRSRPPAWCGGTELARGRVSRDGSPQPHPPGVARWIAPTASG
jgi:hypothetical protein